MAQWKHGMTGTRIYNSWHSMMARCYDPKDQAYSNYGGCGIKVCKAWHTFLGFYFDMDPRPLGKSLDRKNNSKGYSKKNCRWATTKEQVKNSRWPRLITYKGKTKNLRQWSKVSNTNPYGVILRRLNKGYPIKYVLTNELSGRRLNSLYG